MRCQPPDDAAEADDADAVLNGEVVIGESGGCPDGEVERPAVFSLRLGEAVHKEDHVSASLGVLLVDVERLTA